jgi:hypothetical protein
MQTTLSTQGTIAVISRYVNFRDLRRSLDELGLYAEHVTRPTYRESLRWIQDKLGDFKYRMSVPLLFVYENGEIYLAYDYQTASLELERMLERKAEQSRFH